ncbi:adenylate cyclase [Asticcacaulis sp. DW145]|uniref:Uncharacterized protein n=1 Tax=Asticcacaulis currens TaxID=2984210 RepID=A0ABT5IGG1_9CAUL|nr:hypothetical protein [Asticcacaulis currens]MDC7694993.1 hypothetical protein [Asticcacaulis currens]BEV12234.1 adenylate cyclase [Asticcacaulis sp. DW145]
MTSSGITRSDTSAAQERRFFLGMAILLAVTVVIGFGLNAARYHFDTSIFPPHVHVHAAIFMSWIGLYLVQNFLVVAQKVSLHRKLGIFGGALAMLMTGYGLFTTLVCLQRGAVPPFFPPSVFLLIDGLGVMVFFGLVCAAIALRQSPAWHKRLMLGATILVISPAFGRALPMPLLGALAPWAVFACMILYVAIGMAYDLIKDRRVHPAYLVVVCVLTALQLAIGALAFTPPVLQFTQSLMG